MRTIDCVKCKKQLHPSNLIRDSICFNCYEEELEQMEKAFKGFDKFGPAINISFIISIFISIIYLIFNLSDMYGLIIYFTIALIFFFLYLFGTLFPLNCPIVYFHIEGVLNEYAIAYDKYTSGIVVNCVYHPEREAISRCQICFKPLCKDDFCFVGKIPFICLECAPRYVDGISNLKEFNALLSMGLLYGVGIFLELKNTEDIIFSWMFIALFVGIIMIVGVIYYRRRQIKSQLKLKNQ